MADKANLLVQRSYTFENEKILITVWRKLLEFKEFVHQHPNILGNSTELFKQ